MDCNFGLNGQFGWELWSAPSKRSGRRHRISRGKFKNATCLAGVNDILSVYLGAGTQKTVWYLGLIDNAGFSTLSTADTMASHGGWTESATYSEGVRQTWTPSAVSGQSITNPTAAVFSINGTVTLQGAFLVSNSTVSGTSGILWATGSFQSTQSMVNGQQLKITYTCNGTGS